jgi:hypothetical protein
MWILVMLMPPPLLFLLRRFLRIGVCYRSLPAVSWCPTLALRHQAALLPLANQWARALLCLEAN